MDCTRTDEEKNNEPAAAVETITEKLGSIRKEMSALLLVIKEMEGEIGKHRKEIQTLRMDNEEMKNDIAAIQNINTDEQYTYNGNTSEPIGVSSHSNDVSQPLNALFQGDVLDAEDNLDASNILNDSPSPQSNSGWQQYFISSFFSHSTSVYNTRSLHVYCVTAITNRNTHWGRGLLLAGSSLFLVAVQILIFTWVIYESSYPTCSTHSECRAGEFCTTRGSFFYRPRCDDCMFSSNFWDDDICQPLLEDNQWDNVEIDHTVLWLTDPSGTGSNQATDCFAKIHCDDTDMDLSVCDHLVLNKAKVDPTQVVILIFAALLFAVPLSNDIEQAAVEEALLNHGMKRIAPMKLSTWLAAQTIRLSLRTRRLALPLTATATAAAVLIVDSLSAQNILLNILAVNLMTESDDMLAMLLLSPVRQSLPNKLVEDAQLNGAVQVSFFRTRMLGLAAASMLVISILFMDKLVHIFGDEEGTCSDINDALIYFSVWGAICVVVIHGLVRFASDIMSSTKCEALLHGIIEVLVDSAAFFFAALLVGTALLACERPRRSEDPFFIVGFLGLLVTCCIIQVLRCALRKRNSTRER